MCMALGFRSLCGIVDSQHKSSAHSGCARNMVSSKMSALLAVALLLLCSSVYSSADEVQATITQFKSSDAATTAPAITNTTEGSSDSRSAVLATGALVAEDGSPIVLVDLARSDQENMTAMSTTPPATGSVPPGFDMNEFDDGSPSLAATQDGGTLVPGFPPIGNLKDNSQGQSYGVVNYDASSVATEEDPSFATTTEENPSFAATQDGGTLVPGFPPIGNLQDNSQGQSYGVVNYDASSVTTEEDPSFATTTEENPSFAATQDGGTLVPGFPPIGNLKDNSQGQSYGVVNYDASSVATEEDPSFATTTEENPSFAATQDGGTSVPGFPPIGNLQDNSQGQSYGVVNYDASSVTTEEDPSFATTTEENPSFAATQDGGTLVPGFPPIGNLQDNSQGQSYGVVNYDASSVTTEEDPSFATTTEENPSFAATQDGGTLVPGFPPIGNLKDNSQGLSYGVSSSGDDSFAADQEDEYPLEHEDTSDGPGIGVVRPYGPFYGQP